MLVSGSLHVLSPWYLNLNIGSILHASLCVQMLLLASWTIEILSRLIHKLSRRSASHGQVYMLGGAAPSRTCPSLRGVMTIPFNTLNELSGLGVHLGEGINSVVCSSALVTHTCVVTLNASLDQGSVASTPFRRVRHVMKVHMASLTVVHASRIVQNRWLLVEASLDSGIHVRI